MPTTNFNPFDRKSRASDHLTNLRFHVLDVSFSNPVVLSAAYGFKSVTAPTLSTKLREIKAGNYEFPYWVVEAAAVGQVTLEQGVRLFNSDFYDWISTTIPGKAGKRRNFLLIQYSEIAIGNLVRNQGAVPAPGIPSFLTQVTSSVFQSYTDLVSRVPARAWMLSGCLPLEYRAASDFDALGAEVSLAQLTIQPQEVIEFNLGL
ncbi:MAG: phage tail protein [Bacteroidetes bacterium]|nr:phage tail protein [Bacteroidota bacterium]